MVKMIEAVFDGEVLRPTEAINLDANTRVRVMIETIPPAEGAASSFLSTARSLRLDGPPDWSANLDEYLYGGGETHAA